MQITLHHCAMIHFTLQLRAQPLMFTQSAIFIRFVYTFCDCYQVPNYHKDKIGSCSVFFKPISTVHFNITVGMQVSL